MNGALTWNRLGQWWKSALALVIAVVVAQAGVSLLVATPRVHGFLTRHLERAFGRPVEVTHFSVLLLPSPQLDADRVTIGEDPAFGNEYFLRAEHLTANLRWSGLLRARFEFGTLSLSRPSLILVRNAEGRWNLERWLPPAKTSARTYGPPLITAANRLNRINIEDGRVNFKIVDEKLPFAFAGVSGTVEQISAGRWHLQFAAEPWRSGASLQSAGTLSVRGDVAGTSARLQPAELRVHWEQASLADLLRLFRGRDYGVRGVFALDATAQSGAADSAGGEAQPGDWSYSILARAQQIHRWDLNERPDNPRVNVSLLGRLNVASGDVRATRMVVETAKSNLRGTAHASISQVPSWEIHVDSAGVQAADALVWLRAFQPGVEGTVSIEQYFTGTVTLRGWPLQLQDAAFSSEGGIAHVRELTAPLRIGSVEGGRTRGRLTIDPVRISYGAASGAEPALSAAALRRHGATEPHGFVNVGVVHDFDKHAGAVSIEGHVDRVEDALSVTDAFGHPLNHGWELTGAVAASLRCEWGSSLPHLRWNGRIDMVKGELQAAGLNLPLQINKTSLEWKDGLRSALIGGTQGFGAVWSGTMSEAVASEPDTAAGWNFSLHADHIDAAELDRWIGPRARPSWLRRLLPSLLGGGPPPASAASELVRRINAEGDLHIDEFTMERLRLQKVTVFGALHDLHLDIRDATAQWAGGNVRANVNAKFLPRPTYDVTAELDRIDLTKLPAPPRLTERFGGSAWGTVHLTTQGVGRDELLEHLAGRGDIRVRNVDFRGWDVSASVAEGAPRTGLSHWAAGEGAFTLRDQGIVLGGLRLEAGREMTYVKGTVSFGRNANLTIQTNSDGRRDSRPSETSHILRISGPLDVPRVSVEQALRRQPAD
jgi:AsmA family